MGYNDQEIPGTSNSPLLYEAILTQFSTNDPVESVCVNTLGETPAHVYMEVGQFEIGITANLFTDKTFVKTSFVKGVGAIDLIEWEVTAENKIRIYCSLDGVPANLGGGAIGVSITIWP